MLPFKYAGAEPISTTLAEGLSEEIVTGLSRFSYLRVIARSSTARARARTRGPPWKARRPLRDGGQPQARGPAAAPRRQVDRRDDGRASLGEHLQSLLPRTISSRCRTTRPTDRLNRGRCIRRAAAQHESVRPKPAARTADAVPGAAAQPELCRAGDSRGACRREGGGGTGARTVTRTFRLLGDALDHAGREYGHGFGASRETLDRALQAARRAVDADPSNRRATRRWRGRCSCGRNFRRADRPASGRWRSIPWTRARPCMSARRSRIPATGSAGAR